MFLLSDKLIFPKVDLADSNGLLAVGGDLKPERLMLAYKSGIFPWYNEGEPILWYSPNPRMVLFPDKLKVTKSMRSLLRNHDFKITFNKNFSQVIEYCQKINRKDQYGTWITSKMKKAYLKLHELGFAKSVEVWHSDQLIGGLYGIDIGHIFCGESMFSKQNNASKIALFYLAEKLKKEGYLLIDCQVYNNHLSSLGAEEISRNEFVKLL